MAGSTTRAEGLVYRALERCRAGLWRSGGGFWRPCGAAAGGNGGEAGARCGLEQPRGEAACELGNLGEDPRGGIA